MTTRKSAVRPAHAIASVMVLGAALLACKKEEPPPAPAPAAAQNCPKRFKDVADQTKGTTCTCAAADTASGSVWGDGVYTTDSKICRAAVHAGAIPATGGSVTVKPAAGCSSYSGSAKNGVKTGNWGKYPGSYFFEGHGDGTCKKSDKCPGRFKALENVDESSSVTCTCDAAQTQAGPLWGDENIYTSDSSICRAAVHAGAITESGGSVTAKGAPGCSKYGGTEKNGVKAGKWGKYNLSFHFPSKGAAKCP